MRNVLITGGAGFIGSSIALELCKKGVSVTVVDNLSPQIHGNEPDSSYLFGRIKGHVRMIRDDVTSRSVWIDAIKGQDAIIHLAAETGTGQSMYQIEHYSNVNIQATSTMLDILANQKHDVKKVVVASSRAIYGEGKYECPEHGIVYPSERDETHLRKGVFNCLCPKCGEVLEVKATDENSKIMPTSVYGLTKQVQEQMVLLVCKSIRIPAVAFRYQNVYGPGQSLSNPYTGILSIFSKNLMQNKTINIFEDGLESRDFVYIDDVVDATILGLENDKVSDTVYNVGSGMQTTVLDVASKLKNRYASSSEIQITGSYRIGDIRHNFADISKIHAELNFTPKFTFVKGLEKFTDWVGSQSIGLDDSYSRSLLELQAKGLLK